LTPKCSTLEKRRSLVAGVFQINVKLPGNVKPGNQVPVIVTIGGVSSRADVTMCVK